MVVITRFSEQVAEVNHRQTLFMFLSSSCPFVRFCLFASGEGCQHLTPVSTQLLSWEGDVGLFPSHEKNEANRERQVGETRGTQGNHLDPHSLSCSSSMPLVLGPYRTVPTPTLLSLSWLYYLQTIGGGLLQECPGPTALKLLKKVQVGFHSAPSAVPRALTSLRVSLQGCRKPG